MDSGITFVGYVGLSTWCLQN